MFNSFISSYYRECGDMIQYVVKMPSSCHSNNHISFGSEKIYGQFSSVRKINSSTYEAVRDPLGIGKMFYTETSSGELFFSEQFSNLFSHNTKIFAVPAGMHVRLGVGLRQIVQQFRIDRTIEERLTIDTLQNNNIDSPGKLFRDKLESRLNCAFSLIRNLEDEGWKIFVALSGGLDSSIIANFSVKHLKSPVACTLDLGQSEDAQKSTLVARHLDISHMVFKTNEQELLQTIEEAPLLCQDFRDFNVHCAVLNLLLAKNIRSWVNSHHPRDNDRIIVLTGDLMNEYTCDYSEEKIGEHVYYKLPRIGKKDLQRYLIRGLDTSDRELLPFQHYGICCIQPYSLVYDLYENLPENIIAAPDAKMKLNSFLVPDVVMGCIPKTKLRAQVGSKENMGILGLCHRLGFNDRYFRERFLAHSGATFEQFPLFVGKYDVENFS